MMSPPRDTYNVRNVSPNIDIQPPTIMRLSPVSLRLLSKGFEETQKS